MDCTDNLQSRLLINKVCIKSKRSLISGAAIRYEGHIAVFRYDIAIKSCYRCLYEIQNENIDRSWVPWNFCNTVKKINKGTKNQNKFFFNKIPSEIEYIANNENIKAW